MQEAVSRLVQDKTVLIIAHRMCIVTGADRVIVLEKGQWQSAGRLGSFWSRMGCSPGYPSAVGEPGVGAAVEMRFCRSRYGQENKICSPFNRETSSF